MASVNKVILIGNLGADPEVRYTSSGAAVASFQVATNERWIKSNQKKEEHTEWHRIIAFGKLGEICGEYLSKGKQVYLEGRIRTRTWEDSSGNRRSLTEIIAARMQLLGSSGSSTPAESETTEFPEDGIPF